jgi:hypothetical protein
LANLLQEQFLSYLFGEKNGFRRSKKAEGAEGPTYSMPADYNSISAVGEAYNVTDCC